MKNTTERNAFIFDLWANKNLSYKEIAEFGVPNFLSLQRIRNIVYGGKTKLKWKNEQKIYDLFRLKFLELQDVHKSICFVYENQPPHSLHEKTIRRIINKQLKGNGSR